MLGTRFAFKGILLIGKVLLKYSWLWITIILLSSVMINSIKEGIEQEDWSIPAKDLGLFLVSADEKIYEEVQDLEFDMPKKVNLFNRMISFLDFSWYVFKNLFVHLWMILFNFILLYKIFLFGLGDISKKRRAVIISILTMALLQIFVLGIPFRGVFSLIKFVIITLGGM